jgi:hypothetical protein
LNPTARQDGEQIDPERTSGRFMVLQHIFELAGQDRRHP